MKFEKLSENKIRIILNGDDLIKNNIDFHFFMANPIESQTLFFDMLDKAEKEIGFTTKNYNIKIEAMQVGTKDFVLTITRSIPENITLAEPKKKLVAKRKKLDLNYKNIIYCFASFEDFCQFSNYIKNSGISINSVSKNVTLYEYKSQYYLSFIDLNYRNTDLGKVFSAITEFATYVNEPSLFVHKLIESGSIIMKNNALVTAVRYFS